MTKRRTWHYYANIVVQLAQNRSPCSKQIVSATPDQSVSKTVREFVSPSMSHLVSQSVTHSACQPVSYIQLVNKAGPVSQEVSKLVSQSINKSVSWLVGHPTLSRPLIVTQSVNWTTFSVLLQTVHLEISRLAVIFETITKITVFEKDSRWLYKIIFQSFYRSHFIKHLDWQPQTQHVNNRLAKNLQILSKLRYFIDLNILKQLNYILIYPYLSYSILALGCASKTRLDCICIAHPRESQEYPPTKKTFQLCFSDHGADHSLPIRASAFTSNDCITMTFTSRPSFGIELQKNSPTFDNLNMEYKSDEV
ncbi:unnamed protein product [Porites lobata]|uniref:Uncharacterized protein n=1 Tax=Porites lobata TaxID=104759 RepID=A0ABN8RDQ8_9CNID|nr:unnamed protein product [Porites lobata]